ncbi:expressed protein [Phakopsora pachyrhizi]|uniref:Expressed protein n=1 Tax=Phakopsora pachyrhizi TaxID=170000 RepID=A0AAV0APT7_PHAPC|nr:expressed protein [Phakopsora pachyrhizi]
MPELPFEITKMIFEALEAILRDEASASTNQISWHSPGSALEIQIAQQSKFVSTLDYHLRLVACVSKFWYEATDNWRNLLSPSLTRLQPFPNISSSLSKLKIISTGFTNDQALIRSIKHMSDTLISLSLRKLDKNPTVEDWNSISYLNALQILIIHESLLVPSKALHGILDNCLNLKTLELLGFKDFFESSQSTALSSKFSQRRGARLTELTVHWLLPWPARRTCGLLQQILARSSNTLENFTLVFENKMVRDGVVETILPEYSLRDLLSACQSLQTCRISTPDNAICSPFLDQLLLDLSSLKSLQVKGIPFTPELFSSLSTCMIEISLEAYSRPLLPLLSALKSYLNISNNLKSLSITTHRRRSPRSFREAMYGEVSNPPLGEWSLNDLASANDLNADIEEEKQDLLIYCMEKKIALDGPRDYIPFVI